MSGCSGCRAVRAQIKQDLRAGNVVAAAKAAAKGVKMMAAKVAEPTKPRVIKQLRRR